MKALYLLAALPAIACSDITAPRTLTPTRPANETLENVKRDITFGLTACNGEWVELTGELHHVIKVTTNANGYKLSITDKSHFSGIGSVTGAKYEGTSSSSDKEASKDDDFNYSVRTTIRLEAKGKVPGLKVATTDASLRGITDLKDLMVDVLTQFVVKDGEVVTSASYYKEICK